MFSSLYTVYTFDLSYGGNVVRTNMENKDSAHVLRLAMGLANWPVSGL